jgi:ribosome-binding protein aMBF1 (putative translation factor)
MKKPRRKMVDLTDHLEPESGAAVTAPTKKKNAALKESRDRKIEPNAAARAGALVREMRLAKRWSQSELARATRKTQEQISQIERGIGLHGPTFDVIESLAKACGFQMLFVDTSNQVTIYA